MPTQTPAITATPTFTPIVSGLPVQKLFALSGNSIKQYSTSQPNILTGLVNDGVSFDLSSQCVRPQGIFTTEAGTLIYVLDDNVNGGTGTIFKYSLTSWDLSTIVYTGQFYDTSENPINGNLAFRPVDLQFNTTGTKLFIMDDVSDTIYEYNLTANNLTTVAYASS